MADGVGRGTMKLRPVFVRGVGAITHSARHGPSPLPLSARARAPSLPSPTSMSLTFLARWLRRLQSASMAFPIAASPWQESLLVRPGTRLESRLRWRRSASFSAPNRDALPLRPFWLSPALQEAAPPSITSSLAPVPTPWQRTWTLRSFLRLPSRPRWHVSSGPLDLLKRSPSRVRPAPLRLPKVPAPSVSGPATSRFAVASVPTSIH
jgi:hypothetical protein